MGVYKRKTVAAPNAGLVVDSSGSLTAQNALSDEFYTPRRVRRMLPALDLDPCSSPHSQVRARREFDIRCGDDGLELPWKLGKSGVAFVNPPYSNTPRWVLKCIVESRESVDGGVILLIPARPETKFWAKYIWGFPVDGKPPEYPRRPVGFISGRMKFDGRHAPSDFGATFPSAIIVFGGERLLRHLQSKDSAVAWC